MTWTGDAEVERYFYRSIATSPRHRSRVSAYFVERLRGSNVVARIEPLGLVPESIGDEQLAIQRLRRNLVVAGTWQATPSGRHARLRVVPADVTTMHKSRPTELVTSPWGDLQGGRDRRRSGDLTLFRRALYRLSYSTSSSPFRVSSGPDGI